MRRRRGFIENRPLLAPAAFIDDDIDQINSPSEQSSSSVASIISQNAPSILRDQADTGLGLLDEAINLSAYMFSDHDGDS
jgi:hypothetical protein